VNGFVRAVKQCITPPATVAFARATITFAFLRISTAHAIYELADGSTI